MSLFLVLGCSVPVTAQLSIARPKPTSIQQVSATTPALASERDSTRPQIRVSIRYLMVDEQTRSQIYASVDPASIINRSQTLSSPRDERQSEPEATSQPLELTESMAASSDHQFRAPGRVTTCLLNQLQADSIVEIARSSDLNEVSDAPTVILIDGKEAEMNDVVQHPMVVDIQANADLVSPTVKVFEEGLRMRMKASLGGRRDTREGLLLSCEVNTSQTLDVKQHKIYGVQSEPVTVQVPIHVVSSARASTRMAAGQTLMIDPHHNRESSVRRQTGVPVLTRLPYVGRSFKNVSAEPVNRWMIVLLEPSLEASK